MTSRNNQAPLLCHCKLCASFHGHLWIQTGVTVRKHPNWGKICFDLCDLDLWPLTLTFGMDITFVNVNNSWNFTMIQWQEQCENPVRFQCEPSGLRGQLSVSLYILPWSEISFSVVPSCTHRWLSRISPAGDLTATSMFRSAPRRTWGRHKAIISRCI